MKDLEIVYKSVADLVPYVNNPRRNDETVPKLIKSIKEFGFLVPIVFNSKNNNEVVCGHTRLLAAKEMGLKSVPCIDASYLDEQQIKAFRLADNKIQESSEWDYELLSEELNDIVDLNMEDFGFTVLDADYNTNEELEDYEPPQETDANLCKCPACGHIAPKKNFDYINKGEQ